MTNPFTESLKKHNLTPAAFGEIHAAMKETDERDTIGEIVAVIGADRLAEIVAAHGGTGTDRRTAKDVHRCTNAICDAVAIKAAAMGIRNPLLLTPKGSRP